jgi:RNA polymerase sigma-70 factor (ECF subfamily)
MDFMIAKSSQADDVAPFDVPLLESLRRVQQEFLARLDPVRPDLHRYCRRLTGDVWDAEDLLQETLTRACARAAASHQPIQRPLPWLLRIATNTWIDWQRRRVPVPTPMAETAADVAPDPLEVRDALAEMTALLSPQERAAVVLADVFELRAAEIAAMVGTSVGAVKAALHRGRARLRDPQRDTALAQRPVPDRQVVDALAAAFTAYDLERLAGLFLDGAVSDVVGFVHEVGRDTIKSGSLHHTLVQETHHRWRAEVRDLDGEPVVLMWARPMEGSAAEAVEDILRVDTADGGVQRLRWYFFCPETLTEVAERFGVPVRPTGYRFG